MITLSEHEDRFETTILIDSKDVVVSIDKPISQEDIEELSQVVEDSATELLASSLQYISERASEYEIENITHYSDPQIMLGVELVAVYWCSEMGEENGISIIGVDFSRAGLVPTEITIGD